MRRLVWRTVPPDTLRAMDVVLVVRVVQTCWTRLFANTPTLAFDVFLFVMMLGTVASGQPAQRDKVLDRAEDRPFALGLSRTLIGTRLADRLVLAVTSRRAG